MKAKLIYLLMFVSGSAWAATDQISRVQNDVERKIRSIVAPVLEKYCKDQCQLLGIEVDVEISYPNEIAPGFDDSSATAKLAPSAGRVKLLVDEMIGPVSRGHIIDLLEEYLSALTFPTQIETKITRFPKPLSSTSKVAELREKVGKDFKKIVAKLFQDFCPDRCMLADFEITAEQVNIEEAQYGSLGEFIQDGDTAIQVKKVAGTILLDETLSQEERSNIAEMARLKTNYLKNVELNPVVMKFPKPLEGDGEFGRDGKRSLASEEKKSSTEQRVEITKTIERVENADGLKGELEKFKMLALVLSAIFLLFFGLFFIALMRKRGSDKISIETNSSFPNLGNLLPFGHPNEEPRKSGNLEKSKELSTKMARKYDVDRLQEELMEIFVQQPKVAKEVFSRILTEEGVEITAKYVSLFGEAVIMDMFKDPSLQADLAELVDFYSKNLIELDDNEKFDLLKKLENRTVAAKMTVMGNRSTNAFDFLSEMDASQIQELIRNESLTVRAVVMTQCDLQKRSFIFSQMDEKTRMSLLAELSRIDYLPRKYIANVAAALRRKTRENPMLNTEALPGSDVLVTLLERSDILSQRHVIQGLDAANPESARSVKAKLVSIFTLEFLRDAHLLEVVLSLRHDELLQFLKGAPDSVRTAIFSKAPKDLTAELEEELDSIGSLSREAYQMIERKILHKIRTMAMDGIINLIEVNDRMFAVEKAPEVIDTIPPGPNKKNGKAKSGLRRVIGW